MNKYKGKHMIGRAMLTSHIGRSTQGTFDLINVCMSNIVLLDEVKRFTNIVVIFIHTSLTFDIRLIILLTAKKDLYLPPPMFHASFVNPTRHFLSPAPLNMASSK